MPKVSLYSNLLLLGSLLILLTCRGLPTDPLDDPNNLRVSLINTTNVQQNDSVLVGIIVNIPSLVKSLRVIHDEDSKESFLLLNKPSSDSPDTMFFKIYYKTTGPKTITAKIICSDNSAKEFPFEIRVLSPDMKIIFDNHPTDTTVFVNYAANIHISSHTVPSTIIEYKADVTPPIDSSSTLIVNNGSIVFKSSKPGVYTLNIVAFNEIVKDSVKVKVNVISTPQITISSINQVSQPNVGDTLTFTGGATDSLLLLNLSKFKTGEVVILPAIAKNIVNFIFTPQETKTYSFSFNIIGTTADGKKYSGIITIVRNVAGSTTSIWTQDTLSMNAPEGSLIAKPIESYLNNVSLTGVTFTASKGTISQNIWQDSIPWSANEKDTAFLYASYNGTMYVLKIFRNITSADTTGPQISLSNPSISDAKVSASTVTCKFIIADSLSGVGKVNFKIGSTILTDTLHNGNTYQCIVRNLVKGEKTVLTVEAYDNSMKKNRVSQDISLTYDPEMPDNVVPRMSMKTPSTPIALVSTSETTIEIICNDESGVATVTALKGTAPLNVQKSDSIYSVVVSGLTKGATDTVVFEATDSSLSKNKASLTVYITYDRSKLDNQGPKIALKNPAINNSSITVPSINFSVICNDENGIASVKYKSGIFSGVMTRENDSTYTANITGLLSGTNQIFITAKDKSVNSNTTDTTFTIIYNPVTIDLTGPIIVLKTPTADSSKVGSKSINVDVTCTDPSEVASVTCKMGTTDIPVVKGTGDIYTATVTSLVSGANSLVFTATDKAVTPNSSTKTVTVFYDSTLGDTEAPRLYFIKPVRDTVIDVDSFVVSAVCKDPSGIATFTAQLNGTPFLMSQQTPSDSIWTGTIKGLISGAYATIKLKATDDSKAKNTDSTSVRIKYDGDATGPVITLSTPTKDSAISNSSNYTAIVKCTDSSGVLSVNGVLGTKTFKGARDTGSTWKINITDLTPDLFNIITLIATDSSLHANKTLDTLYIKSEITNGYTITFDKNDTAATGTMTVQTITSGTAASLTTNVFTKTGCAFAGWATSATGAVAYADGASYTMGTANVTLYAKWTTNSHTITFNKNDTAATGTMVTQNVTEGTAAPLTANVFIKAGSSFAGWATSATGAVTYADGASYTMGTANVTLYAKWTTNSHTITFDKNDAAATGTMVTQNVTEGTAAPLAANVFIKAGSSFAGWATSATGAVTYADGASYTMGTANVTLYAKWTAITHTVTFNKNDTAATGTMATQTIAEGVATPLTANAFIKAGSSFVGWAATATGAVTYADGASYTIGTANVTLYAKYSANTHTITFDKNDTAATGTMVAQNVAEGTAAPLTTNAFTKAGSSFAGWATSATGAVTYADGASYTMATANITLYAKWTINIHAITFDKNDVAATGTMANQSINEGSAAPLTANAFVKTGYSFAGWATSATGAVAYADAASYTMGTANVTLYAKWTAITHSVIFDKNDAGATGTMANQTIAEGTAAPLTANAFAKTGFSFAGWATSATGAVTYADAASYTMGTANITLYAKWTAITHTVTFDKNDAAATGTMANQTIAEGTAAALTTNAFTKTGYSFAGWASSATGAVVYSDAASITMGTANVMLFAKWTAITHTVTFDKNDAAATGTMANQTIAEGTSVALTANAFIKTGYSFAGWATSTTGAVVYLNSANYPMGTVSVTLYAKWTPNNNTITFDKNDAAATGTMANQTIASGASVALASNGFTKAGWAFAGWATSTTGEVVYLNGANYTMGTASVTLYAKWTINTYQLTLSSTAGGSITAPATSPVTVTHGVANTITASPGTGYYFSGWTVSGSGTVANSTSATTTVTLTGPATVTANFTPNLVVPTNVSATSPVCSGNSSVLTADAPLIGTLHWYSGSCGVGAVGQGNSVNTGALTSNTTFYVRAELGSLYGSCASVTVNISQSPTITISGGGKFCYGSSTILRVQSSGTSFSQYQWYNQSGIITGAQSSAYSASASGTYYCACKTSAGCTFNSPSATVNISTIEVEPIMNDIAACSNQQIKIPITASCQVSTVEWYVTSDIGTNQVKSDGMFYIISDDGTLTIPYYTDGIFKGLYFCKVYDYYGHSATSNSCNIHAQTSGCP